MSSVIHAAWRWFKEGSSFFNERPTFVQIVKQALVILLIGLIVGMIYATVMILSTMS